MIAAMQLDLIIIRIGDTPVTLLQGLMVAAFAVGLLLWRMVAARRSSQLEYRLAEMAGALRNFAAQAGDTQSHLARTLDERLSDQTERTGASLTQLYERLAVIDSAQKNLSALSGEMMTLKDILANKQTRGAYGQGRMEAIIRDGLHSRAYSFQSTLSNGMRPDCLIKLPDSDLQLVVDAKFPLEAFNALKLARSDAERRSCEARLRSDVQKHVRDIAEKYLIAGETHETAMMFVPSESVYADLHEHFEDVIQKSYRARVIIASPNVLMLLIQTMQAIFKDVAMREQAGLIKIEVAKLLDDVGRLGERAADLRKHFGAANVDLEKLGISADKVAKRALRIESLELEEPIVPDIKPRLVERG